MRFKTYDKNQYFLKITSDLQYYNHYEMYTKSLKKMGKNMR